MNLRIYYVLCILYFLLIYKRSHSCGCIAFGILLGLLCLTKKGLPNHMCNTRADKYFKIIHIYLTECTFRNDFYYYSCIGGGGCLVAHDTVAEIWSNAW